VAPIVVWTKCCSGLGFWFNQIQCLYIRAGSRAASFDVMDRINLIIESEECIGKYSLGKLSVS